MKILDFAIAAEMAEKDLYQRLSECSPDIGIRSIFKMIADDEGKLLNKLRKLKENPENRQAELHAPLKTQSAYRNNDSTSCDLLEQQKITDDLGSYRYILQTEQLLLNLYTRLQQRENDPQSSALLRLILDEKRAEIDRVQMLYEFIQAPDDYFNMGESVLTNRFTSSRSDSH